jgi:FdhD protein
MPMKNKQVEHIAIHRIREGIMAETEDQVAVEEPLEIRLAYSTATGRMQKNIAVTMRTPGNDEELSAGFLFTENIIQNKEAIHEIRHIAFDYNRILVDLHENILPLLNKADRNFYSSSSCGICGKASIDAIRTISVYKDDPGNISVKAALLYGLPDALRKQQEVFENTGGIHASALFTLDAEFIMLREDVGRHNALDKIIGAALVRGDLPLNKCILLLSGRASFELLQKAAMAGIKIVAAVGAPSSLAVELAKETGITLIGFLRNDRFNIYSGEGRIGL